MPKEDSDRRLLELAALAHGYIDDTTSDSHDAGLHRGNRGEFYITDVHSGWWAWNPLTDDGDAFRLMVALYAKGFVLHLEGGAGGVCVTVRGVEADEWNTPGKPFDPCAATRRAIVMAAAEIGLALENEGKKNA